ncbi:MAG TPA: winged helix-turn-helix domain-containing protein, partial [Luteitalea sp.]|nr:winged helix-turn-helix domain-containing protein [Luteitalea sp.]
QAGQRDRGAVMMMVDSPARSSRDARCVPADATAIGSVILEWLGLNDAGAVDGDGIAASPVVAIQVAVAGAGADSAMPSEAPQVVVLRSHPAAPARDAHTGDLAIDVLARTARRGATLVPLTGVEFDVLRGLVAQVGNTVSRDQLARVALGRSCDPGDRSIDVHVGKLRRKLGPHPCGCPRIRTVRGVGYVYTTVSR